MADGRRSDGCPPSFLRCDCTQQKSTKSTVKFKVTVALTNHLRHINKSPFFCFNTGFLWCVRPGDWHSQRRLAGTELVHIFMLWLGYPSLHKEWKFSKAICYFHMNYSYAMFYRRQDVRWAVTERSPQRSGKLYVSYLTMGKIWKSYIMVPGRHC